MKKAEVIELLKLMAENTRAVAYQYEEEDKDFHEKLFREYMGMNIAIMVLTDSKFAKSMADIYMK